MLDDRRFALLERIARGDPLPELLESIVRLAEEQSPGMIGSVVQMQHGAIQSVIGPSLPAEYRAALIGLAIGPRAGSCGTAAYLGTRVIVSDVEADDRWADYRDLVRPYGLRACWSSPITLPEAGVVGTFAMYYREVRSPSEAEIRWIDEATHLAALAMLRDRAAHALRQSEAVARAEEKHRALVYSMVADIMFYLEVEDGPHYRFLSVNGAFQRSTGLTEQQVVGRRVDEVIPPSSLPLVLERYAEAIRTGRPVTWEEESDYPSGIKRGEVTVAPVLDAGGRCTHLIGTVHDVTERARAEHERRQLEAQLHQSQRMQSLGTLAGGIAHDFNNILTAIRGYADLALADIDGTGASTVNLEGIRTSAQRAADLVRRILLFSRGEEPRLRTIDPGALINDALNLLRATLKQVIDIRTTIAAGLPPMLGDPTQIHQVLMNLGTNAAQAIGSEGGIMEVMVDAVIVDAAALPAVDLAPGRYVRISVRDNGSGMDEATRSRVFEPFFTTKGPTQGTGLGLSVVHGIMKNHGGAVTVDSEVGAGTTFHLYFPAVNPIARETVIDAPPVATGNGERVLYVDDDETLVYIARRSLSRLGYRVIGHSDPAEALAAFRAAPDEVDIVVTDTLMPGLSGFDLVDELRKVRPALPVLMLSGYVSDQDCQRAGELGVPNPLLKPISAKELGEAIQRCVHGPAN